MVDTPEVSRARSARAQDTLEDQVARLQDDIKSISASLARLGEAKVGEARSVANAKYGDIVQSGQGVVDDISGQLIAYEDQLIDAIRERPLAAVAGAMGIGYLIAVLSRR